jgi:hypothetical protein
MRRAAVLTGVAVALPALAVVGSAAPASAASVIPCQTRTTATPFKQWSDTNNYFTLPSGNFESTPTGWTLTGGAALTSENEPYKVISGVANAKSLKLPPGASVTAPSFCVKAAEPQIRFFYKSPGVANSYLVLTMTAVFANGTSSTSSQWLMGDKAGWVVTPAYWLPNVADSVNGATVTVSFQQKNVMANWQLDDFEVDPWKSM